MLPASCVRDDLTTEHLTTEHALGPFYLPRPVRRSRQESIASADAKQSKSDASPVTVADYGAQALVSAALATAAAGRGHRLPRQRRGDLRGAACD